MNSHWNWSNHPVSSENTYSPYICQQIPSTWLQNIASAIVANRHRHVNKKIVAISYHQKQGTNHPKIPSVIKHGMVLETIMLNYVQSTWCDFPIAFYCYVNRDFKHAARGCIEPKDTFWTPIQLTEWGFPLVRAFFHELFNGLVYYRKP